MVLCPQLITQKLQKKFTKSIRSQALRVVSLSILYKRIVSEVVGDLNEVLVFCAVCDEGLKEK
jgi:hypothetical protein